MTTIDWNAVRRRLVTEGFTEEEAVEAVAIMADGVCETQVDNAGMFATQDDVKEFERRLTNRFALMCLLWVVVVAMIIRWFL